jgi:hypothetical protein
MSQRRYAPTDLESESSSSMHAGFAGLARLATGRPAASAPIVSRRTDCGMANGSSSAECGSMKANETRWADEYVDTCLRPERDCRGLPGEVPYSRGYCADA